MGVVNRTLDQTEQRDTLQGNFAATATGVTLQAFIVPSQSNLEAVRMAGFGLSNAPAADINIMRFITGAGVTSIAGVATQLVFTTVGTSGIQSMVLAAAGNSLLQLLAGDIITVKISGANANLLGLTVAAVVRNTQEIKTSFGV